MKRIVGIVAVLVPAVTAACNEVAANPFDSSGVARASGRSFPGSSSGSGVTALPLVTCASSEPRDGTSCQNSALRCEYGSHVDARCNPFFECDGNAWHEAPGESCAGACPSNRADIVAGEPCVLPDARSEVETLCAAATELCACRRGDDGASRWTCTPRDAGCPAMRPRIGSTCGSARVCDYGACIFESGLTMECVMPGGGGSSFSPAGAGVWLVREPSCSTSGLENNP